MRTIEAKQGTVDLLVNNAGYMQSGPLEELALDAVRREFETNVFGLLRMAQLVLPGMRRRGRGRIINVGSVGGLLTAPGAGAYHARKYAFEALTDALRYEVRSFGVDVVLIQPTGVRTPFIGTTTAVIGPTPGDSPYAAFNRNYDAQVHRMFAASALGLVTAEDVARVIVDAARARHPRTRYKVGLSAHLYARLRRALPDRAWDALMARQFPMTPRAERAPETPRALG